MLQSIKTFFCFVFTTLSFSVFSQDLSENYRLVNSRFSLSGEHLRYQKHHEQLPVSNVFKHCFVHHKDTNCIVVIDSLSLPSDFESIFLEKRKVLTFSTPEYYFSDNKLSLGMRKVFFIDNDYPVQVISDGANYIDFKMLYSFYKDTVLKCKVFNPNPVASSGLNYGGQLIDNNDANSLVLEQELVEKEIRLNVNSDGDFQLKNSWVNMVDLSLPNLEVPVFTRDSLFFTRDYPEFEAVNAYYHVNQFLSYLSDTLGFTNLVSDTIQIDVHALNGMDNSVYRNAGTPQILFGDGGVDDAEDGQVVIHELTHALFNFSSPNSNVGIERNAIDEGSADFLAAMYTSNSGVDDFNAIPNWDGHNEFWDGRIVNANKKYPTDYVRNIYEDGEIWASALTQLSNQLGVNKTVKLLLESSYFYYSNMTMPHAGALLLKTDSLIHNGIYSKMIAEVLCEKGLLNNCDQFIPNYENSVYISSNQLLQRKIRFSANVEQYNNLRIFDASGKVCLTDSGLLSLWYNLENLTAGVYLVFLNNDQNSETIKIILL